MEKNICCAERPHRWMVVLQCESKSALKAKFGHNLNSINNLIFFDYE